MFKPSKSDHPAGFRPIWARLALLPLCALAAQAQADGIWDDCVRNTGNPLFYEYYQAYLPTTIQLPNSAQVGDIVSPWIATPMHPAWKCTRRIGYSGTAVNVSVRSGLVYNSGDLLDTLISHEGGSYRISRFGDYDYEGGLSYIARWRATINGVTTDWTALNITPGLPQPANSTVTVAKNAGDVYYIQVETQIRLIKRSAALVPGYTQRLVDPTYTRHYQQVGTVFLPGDVTYLIPQLSAGRLNFVGGGTCTTSSVPDPVKLPTVVAGDFSGQGSTLGTTPFDLKLESCPAGLYSIGYYFTPATAILDATNGVIALDGSSSATGVGLQLTEDTGTPLKFANTYPLTTYDPSAVNTYTVPLKVAYYQTGNTPVGSGSVSASMTVMLKYQ